MSEMNAAGKKSMGCGGCLLYLLGGILVVVAALLGGGYYTLMHTAYPLKKIATLIEETASPEAPISIKGISGSFSSGARIKSLRWQNGEVENLCISYDNLAKSIRSKRFVFREISVTKAHISVFDFDSESNSKTSEPSVEKSAENPLDWELFQIDKLSLADVFLTNRLTGFSITIPKFEWTGFKWEKGKTEFGTIKADTDAFKVETARATLPGFVSRLTGTIRPRLHASILKEFNFEAEIGPLGSNTPCRVSAFDGALTATVGPDGTGSFKVHDLAVDNYFKDLWLRNVNLEIETQKQGTENTMHIKSGSFCLGETRFIVNPGTIRTKETTPAPLALLEAQAEVNGTTIQYTLSVKENEEKVSHQLKSQPSLKPAELTALILFGKSSSELTPAEAEKTQKLQSLLTY